MTEFFDMIPVFDEDYTSEDAIRARIIADANQGVEPDDPDFVDTRDGSWFAVNTGAVIQEIARVWDGISTDVVAATRISMAWGEFLDYHAADLGLERKEPVKATGTVLFTGTEGTLVPADMRLSALQTDPSAEPPEFATTESGTISETLLTPTGLGATGSTSGGALAAGTYYYKVTAVNEYGETIASNEVSATIAGTGHVTLDWNDVAGASGYKVYRSTSTGNEKFLKSVVNSTHTDQGADATTLIAPPGTNTTGGKFRADTEAVDEGTEGNVGVGAIDAIQTPIVGVDTATNDTPFSGGADEESDEALRERLLLEMLGGGPGTVADYKRWALAYPGIGRATVIPIGDGPGTVVVIIMDVNGDPVSQAVVDAFQAYIDPLPGQGEGVAPIDHNVNVSTPAQVLMDIVATLDFDDGYTLDGTSGTVPLRDRITAALSYYIDSLEAGTDVVFDHVKAAFYSVHGVYKVTALTLEGGSSDVVITTSPAQVAALGTVTLSEI